MVFIEYPKQSNVFFKKKLNTPTNFKRYVMEPNVFMGYPTRRIACVLNSFEHEQYLSNSTNQNKSTHGI